VDRANDTIAYAYSLSARRTEHRIELQGRELHALCAIDALGAAAMYRSDVVVSSSCRRCATTIVVQIEQGGKRPTNVSPIGAVVKPRDSYNLPNLSGNGELTPGAS
jgi:hypothetical protein